MAAKRVPNWPPARAPPRNAAIAARREGGQALGTRQDEPEETTLPVMPVTKTWPRARWLTASTRPVTTVSVSMSGGSGPCGSPGGRQQGAGGSVGSLRVRCVPSGAVGGAAPPVGAVR
ncbi:hypothetical protein SGLAM104S_08446 [Streptomyces glaucescens]